MNVKTKRCLYILIAVCFLSVILFYFLWETRPESFTESSHPPPHQTLHPNQSNEEIDYKSQIDQMAVHHNRSSSLHTLWFKLQDDLLIRRLCFFDTRDESHIAVVFNTMHDDRVSSKPTLYAELVYRHTRLCVELEYWTKSWNLNYADQEYFVNYLQRTKDTSIPNEFPLYAMIGKNCTGPMAYIPVHNEPQRNFTYGVCLHKGLYSLHDPQLLVDWVELNMALGAETITVYLQNVSESYYTVMLPYIRKGIVEVLDWNLKPPLIKSYTKHWGQTGTISECIFRNIYRVKYLALIDVDEFIVPQQRHSVVDMLKDLEELSKSVNPASFIFYNTYVYSDGKSLPEVETANKCKSKNWPRYYTYTLRVADPEKEHVKFHWHKIVAKTKAVNAAWYHWTASVQKGFSGKRYHVQAKYGLTLHYRKPELRPRKRCRRNFQMSRYFSQTSTHLQQNC